MGDDLTREHEQPDEGDELDGETTPTEPQGAAGNRGSGTYRLGPYLRALRETYVWRLAGGGKAFRVDHVPQLSLSELIVMLTNDGYRVSLAEYQEIEKGRVLPLRSEPFIDSITRCLHLDSEQLRTLVLILIRDRALEQLGPDFSGGIFP